MGASATAAPVILAQTTGFVPTSSPSPSSHPSSSTTPSPSSFTPSATAVVKTTSSKGAAIGGGIGGAVAACIIGVLLFLLFRKRKMSQGPSTWRGPEMSRNSDFGSETAYARGTVFSNKTDPSDPFNTIHGLPYAQPQGFATPYSPHASARATQQDVTNIGGNVYPREANYPPVLQPSPPPQNVAVSGSSSGQERYTAAGDAGMLAPLSSTLLPLIYAKLLQCFNQISRRLQWARGWIFT